MLRPIPTLSGQESVVSYRAHGPSARQEETDQRTVTPCSVSDFNEDRGWFRTYVPA